MSLKLWHWIVIIILAYFILVSLKISYDVWTWQDRKFSLSAQCEDSKLYIDYDGLNLYMTTDSTKPMESRRSYIAGPDKKLETIRLPDKQVMTINRINWTISIGKSTCDLKRFERIK